MPKCSYAKQTLNDLVWCGRKIKTKPVRVRCDVHYLFYSTGFGKLLSCLTLFGFVVADDHHVIVMALRGVQLAYLGKISQHFLIGTEWRCIWYRASWAEEDSSGGSHLVARQNHSDIRRKISGSINSLLGYIKYKLLTE